MLAGSRGSIVRRPGGRPLDCGPHGLAILDLFREPCRVQEAVDHLVARAGSVVSAAEMIGVVIRLHDAAVRPPSAVVAG